MKSRILTCITAMTLFAALATPVRLAAQEHTTHFRHYKLIDIGTFGGPESYVNPSYTFGSHNQINQPGTIVGGAATSIPTSPTSTFFVCGGLDGLVPFVTHAFKWQNGGLTDLGALPGGNNCSVATSINARGEIAGFSENGVIDPVLGANTFRAVLWKDGEIKDLGTLGGAYSTGDAINSRGQVAGFAFNAIPDPLSYIYFALAGSTKGTQTRAYLWDNGVMHDLDTLGGNDAVALFVNERGQIAGFSYTNFTPNPVTQLPTTDPFLWTREEGMKDLGTLGGTFGMPTALNNRGQVVGGSSVAADPGACSPNISDMANCHPFFWENGRLTDLNTESIGGNPLTARTLSDSGEVVGTAAFPGRPISDAYLWRKGVARDLGVVDDDCFSEAFAINSQDQIVGSSFPCALNFIRTFLWEKGSIVDLDALAGHNASLQLVEAFSINDRGEIGGVGVPPGCGIFSYNVCGHAFLLIPVCADGSEGCAHASLDPAIVAKSRVTSSAVSRTMTPEELATFKKRMARMGGQNRGFGLWPRR